MQFIKSIACGLCGDLFIQFSKHKGSKCCKPKRGQGKWDVHSDQKLWLKRELSPKENI